MATFELQTRFECIGTHMISVSSDCVWISDLESIVTIRIHLDPCPVEAGPLRVIPASHLRGLFSYIALGSIAIAVTMVYFRPGF